MELTSDLVDAARRGKRDAIIELLSLHYPIVWRMAAALAGRADVGRGTTRFLMHRSLSAMSAWKDETAPTRWFHHHTVLTTRRTYQHQPDAATDTLLGEGANDPAYVAFIRGLRSLPMQQREAFILCHGEKLDIRAAAVAMDCSMLAAGNHLREASDRLRALAPEEFDARAQRMAEAYRTLTPDKELSVQEVRERVRRFIAPWRFKRMLGKLVSLLLIVAAAWGLYWAYRIAEHSLDR